MNEHEFIEKIMPLKNKIFRMSLRMLGNREDAEDATQEVFLKLWINIKLLAKHPNIEAFSMLTAKNLCIDKLRKRKIYFEEINPEITVAQDNPEDMAIQSDMATLVKNIIDELPPQQKLIIHLRDVEQYELPEIAEITEMNEITIRVTLSRARKKVKDIFEQRYKNE